MEQKEIKKAFEGRWNYKCGDFDDYEIRQLSGNDIKAICRDFFEAGILLGEGFKVAEIYDEQGKPTDQIIVYKHDPILDTSDYGFSEWWEMYGKKIDRAKCEKKWAKLSMAEKQACIDATPAYVASTPDLQYRRHPATFLNNKSWENQIIPRNNGTDKPTIEEQRISRLASILTD